MRYLLGVLSLLYASAQPIPVRGLHVNAPTPDEMVLALKFIREALPREGVNTLFVEFNYHYRYERRPEVADDAALSRDDLRQLAAAAREVNVRLVPMINLLGHQSWTKTNFGLLRSHPEFDETPGLYPDSAGIYFRSYCPLHPQVHAVVFDLIDELVEATQADSFHAGMDEVILIGEDSCARCRGKNKAELFAGEVRILRDHLASQGKTLWIWGDRLLDGVTTGMGKWEASSNDTFGAIALIPKDVKITDWHYNAPQPTAPYFALQGFSVTSSPWRKPGVALRQLDLIRATRRDASPQVAQRMLGVVQTTWVGFGPFVRAYFGEKTADPQIIEALNCFRELFGELRRMP
jgi:hypothetical protein